MFGKTSIIILLAKTKLLHIVRRLSRNIWRFELKPDVYILLSRPPHYLQGLAIVDRCGNEKKASDNPVTSSFSVPVVATRVRLRAANYCTRKDLPVPCADRRPDDISAPSQRLLRKMTAGPGEIYRNKDSTNKCWNTNWKWHINQKVIQGWRFMTNRYITKCHLLIARSVEMQWQVLKSCI